MQKKCVQTGAHLRAEWKLEIVEAVEFRGVVFSTPKVKIWSLKGLSFVEFWDLRLSKSMWQRVQVQRFGRKIPMRLCMDFENNMRPSDPNSNKKCKKVTESHQVRTVSQVSKKLNSLLDLSTRYRKACCPWINEGWTKGGAKTNDFRRLFCLGHWLLESDSACNW